MKFCPKCEKRRPSSEFFLKKRKEKYGLDWICKKCKMIQWAKYRSANLERYRNYVRDRLTRLRSNPTLWNAYKKRNVARQQAWLRNNPEKLAHKKAYAKQYRIKNLDKLKQKAKTRYQENKAQRLAKLHQISIGQCQALLNVKLCKICESHSTSRSLVIDHCHTTKKVRGVLCVNCNAGLGQFKDSATLLQSAIQYLTDAKTQIDKKAA